MGTADSSSMDAVRVAILSTTSRRVASLKVGETRLRLAAHMASFYSMLHGNALMLKKDEHCL